MMKYFITTLIFIFTLKMEAQDPRLLDNTWYFNNGNLEDEAINIPFPEFSATLQINDINFALEHPFCEDYLAGNTASIDNTTFTLENGFVKLLGICEPGIFDTGKHYSIYYFKDSSAKNPFNYTIEEINDYLQLTVTNANGDFAVYNSVLLNNATFINKTVSIHPNPVINSLTINSTEPIKEVTIYNLLGQPIKTITKEFNLIDVSHLTTGVYFVKITAQNGSVIKKLVKE